MHTLISHVDDPGRVLSEARRVLRPGGTVAIFDGDALARRVFFGASAYYTYLARRSPVS